MQIYYLGIKKRKLVLLVELIDIGIFLNSIVWERFHKKEQNICRRTFK